MRRALARILRSETGPQEYVWTLTYQTMTNGNQDSDMEL